MTHIGYTPEEDALVLDVTKKDKEISKLIGKSISSIRSRRHSLRVLRGLPYQNRGELNRQFIKEHLNDMTVSEMAKELNLTTSGIHSHIRAIRKLDNIPYYNATSAEVTVYCEQIKELFSETESNSELAKKLGISKPQLNSYIRKLKGAGIVLKRMTPGDKNNQFLIEHHEDMSYRELADALGLSLASIPTYLNRLRKKGLISYKSRPAISRSMRKYHSLHISKYDKYRDFIQENYHQMSYDTMAGILGIKSAALAHYVHSLQKRGELPYKNYVYSKRED